MANIKRYFNGDEHFNKHEWKKPFQDTLVINVIFINGPEINRVS